MKKLGLLLLGIVFSVGALSIGKDSLNAVTMVSYEQDAYDTEGRLALKNNTDENIYNVVYRIIYMDMSGTPLDYEDFSCEVDIAPGLTKKVNVPAYEQSRGYSYYQSEPGFDEEPQFKIKFELKGYNLDEEAYDAAENPVEGNDWMYGLIVLFFVLTALGLWIGMYVLVGVMARQRRRSAAVWVLLSLIATPLLMVFILLCIGKASNGSMGDAS